jgi:myosin-5
MLRACLRAQMEDTWQRTQRAALTLQTSWRMTRERRRFLRLRRATVRIQAHARGVAARLAFRELLRRHRAAIVVQARFRSFAQRKRYGDDPQEIFLAVDGFTCRDMLALRTR